MYWKVGLFIIGCLIGWFINGWRLQSKIATMEKNYAENVAEVYELVRQREEELTEKIEKLEKRKNGEIANVNARLRVALSELSERTSRDTASKDTSDCKGTTGSELSREDAVFLAREAARADRLRAALGACYVQYDEVRKKGQ
jgi:hypothetical protein